MKRITTINIPNTAKRNGETNEEAFLRILDTWMGEHEHEWGDYKPETLGAWVTKYMKRFKANTFPCAWVEDEDGNVTDYYVFHYRNGKKYLKHETV